MSQISLVSLVVRDYDEAITFYVELLGFDLLENAALPDGKRWVVVAPPGGPGTGLLLARAETDAQRARIGNQTGGRVFLFLNSINFVSDYQRMKTAGVRFVETPRNETYGTVAVFEDLYGNRWDLIEPRRDSD
jgi:catechol 2,3-dioxygenase-like lactoylglutathione lyase family enzyme